MKIETRRAGWRNRKEKIGYEVDEEIPLGAKTIARCIDDDGRWIEVAGANEDDALAKLEKVMAPFLIRRRAERKHERDE